jgi:hypothetical protein
MGSSSLVLGMHFLTTHGEGLARKLCYYGQNENVLIALVFNSNGLCDRGVSRGQGVMSSACWCFEGIPRKCEHATNVVDKVVFLGFGWADRQVLDWNGARRPSFEGRITSGWSTL